MEQSRMRRHLEEVRPRLELLEVVHVLLARLGHGGRPPNVHQIVANHHSPARDGPNESW